MPTSSSRSLEDLPDDAFERLVEDARVIAPAGGAVRRQGWPSLFDTPADRRVAALAWTAALAASFVLIALIQFRSGDPDSNVYAGISARLAAEPFERWIAPEWWGQWKFDRPFREHPIGIFILPALAARLGYPAPQAAYAVNGLFQAASIVLRAADRGASRVAPRRARARVDRAADADRVRLPDPGEPGVRGAGGHPARACSRRSGRAVRPAWAWLTALGFAWALLVKGVFGFVVPIACGVWLAVAAWSDRESADGAVGSAAAQSRPVAPWIGPRPRRCSSRQS